MNKFRLNQDGPNLSTDPLDFISTRPVRTYLTYDSGSRKKDFKMFKGVMCSAYIKNEGLDAFTRMHGYSQ